MQNPFTTTFSKTPEYTYIHTEKTEEILENFVYENPSESVYKITKCQRFRENSDTCEGGRRIEE